jgi:hypothetical protein
VILVTAVYEGLKKAIVSFAWPPRSTTLLLASN